MPEQFFITSKMQKGYSEEMIILDDIGLMLNYALSNNLDDITMAINDRTGFVVNWEYVTWKLNPALSFDVRDLMNRHCVSFSVTTFEEGKKKQVIVNMRVGDKWFIAGFQKVGRSFYSWDRLLEFNKMYRLMKSILQKDNDTDQ